jgi:hypothetical protein
MSIEISRRFYNELRCQRISNETFRGRIAQLLEKNPYFFSGYLEFLWSAEESHDTNAYASLLDAALSAALSLFSNKNNRRNFFKASSDADVDALKDVLELIILHHKKFSHRVIAKALHLGLGSEDPKLVNQVPRWVHLKKISSVLVDEIANEVLQAAPFWWQVNIGRQQTISHHQFTHTIVLRSRINQLIDYQPVDGIHESIATEESTRFPKTHAFAIEWAERLGLGLGRVALVKMAPQSQAYRHFDGEPFLVGRKRYHLVIACGKNNIIESGDDVADARPGELWFYDNAVMHRSHNRSNVERIHLIFDGFPRISRL